MNSSNCFVYNLKFNLIFLSSSQSWRSNLFFRSCLLAFLINEHHYLNYHMSLTSHTLNILMPKQRPNKSFEMTPLWVYIRQTIIEYIHLDNTLFGSLRVYKVLLNQLWSRFYLIHVKIIDSLMSRFFIESNYSLIGINECNIY